jgi:probable phosphoglycerate mutase
MGTFLLIRHAENDFVGSGRIAGRMPGVHLNVKGREQAEQLAARLAGAGIDRIFSSPLQRALETAAPLAARLGLQA